MQPLLVLNWKMNFTLQEAEDFCARMAEVGDIHYDVIICPSAPYLAWLANKFSYLNFCAQDVSNLTGFGAHTGEYSAQMLKSCGINYALVGHSERRRSETTEVVKQKVTSCINADITPIICLGEPLNIR